MNSAILIGMAVVLLLFIWSWIGLVIINRMTLEKKIEKLANITNPLPEEERTLRNLKDLRMIEQSKVASARLLLSFFMLLLLASLVAAPWWNPLYDLFGSGVLVSYSKIAFLLLTFFCLPIYVGLSLAGPAAPKEPKDEAGKAAAA